ncbi:MAG: chemotaxis protein [Telmatospirillum sp.]|nr:chemotaxis protein [Telmatospirillum sp.]
MKLIFRQYLASLRERRELDVIIPDLLSELGFTVLSRPSIGTRQYGVDVAAIGRDVDGENKLFLLSIKQGDLTRAEWDGTPQALRSSLNEILDVYIPKHIAAEHQTLKIVVCLCFGGEIHESIQSNVIGYTEGKATEVISFKIWNGDHIAGMLAEGTLREQLLEKELRADFQKAVAMVDEPDISFKHFSALTRKLCNAEGKEIKNRLTSIRQLNICLWVLFVWARDVRNVEGPYRASEFAILQAWAMINRDLAGSSKASREIADAFSQLLSVHFEVWDELLKNKILPFVDVKFAISAAVGSSSSVDVNLKLFEVLGRLAQRGIWTLWMEGGQDPLPQTVADEQPTEARELAGKIIELIRNNPTLLSPINDAQSADIGLAIVFLSSVKSHRVAARHFVTELIDRICFAYQIHGRYPTIQTAYRDLLDHPRERTDAYRVAQTSASTLIPLLSLWASSLGADDAASDLAQFATKFLGHCAFQFWVPGEDTEAKIFSGTENHGASLSGIPITADGETALDILNRECSNNEAFTNLSTMRLDHWPVLAMACRYHRLPLPPNIWLPLLLECRTDLTMNASPTSSET